MRNESKPGNKIIVPIHGKSLKPGTSSNILKKAELPIKKLKELLQEGEYAEIYYYPYTWGGRRLLCRSACTSRVLYAGGNQRWSYIYGQGGNLAISGILQGARRGNTSRSRAAIPDNPGKVTSSLNASRYRRVGVYPLFPLVILSQSCEPKAWQAAKDLAHWGSSAVSLPRNDNSR